MSDVNIGLFPTPVLKCNNFLNTSEVCDIFQILKNKIIHKHEVIVGGKSSHNPNGHENIIETYKVCKNTAITHTLSLYSNILKLENQDLFESTNENAVTMDKVFENITHLYDKKELMVVFNILKKLEETSNDQYKEFYLNALTIFLQPIQFEIKKWIHSNLTC